MNKLRREAAELEVENTTLKKEKVSWYLCSLICKYYSQIFICFINLIILNFLQDKPT